jgi:hypothetical protein
MIRLSAKIDIGSIALTTRMSRNVESTVVMPMASGSSAAIRPRKTTSETRKSSGKASSSARARSSCTWVPTCSPMTSGPPTTTPGCSSSRSTTGSESASLRSVTAT